MVWGGEFESQQHATKRLMVIVPVVLNQSFQYKILKKILSVCVLFGKFHVILPKNCRNKWLLQKE